jgi:hypothetical protein
VALVAGRLLRLDLPHRPDVERENPAHPGGGPRVGRRGSVVTAVASAERHEGDVRPYDDLHPSLGGSGYSRVFNGSGVLGQRPRVGVGAERAAPSDGVPRRAAARAASAVVRVSLVDVPPSPILSTPRYSPEHRRTCARNARGRGLR